MYFLPIDTNIH